MEVINFVLATASMFDYDVYLLREIIKRINFIGNFAKTKKKKFNLKPEEIVRKKIYVCRSSHLNSC